MAAELAASVALPAVIAAPPRRWSAAQVWSALWPKLGAVALVLLVWQLVVWSGWRAQSVLPGPVPVLQRLGASLGDLDFYAGLATTLRRALAGYAFAAGTGVAVAILVARIKLLRRAVGAVLVGLQSMPSIAWFPFAVLLLARTEGAITFVVVLGAAPAIASGLLSGIDQVEPMQLRAGRSMGAAGLRLYRHVILPAALPAFVGGLKQGWAFAWRSLMSAELLVAAGASLGVQLQAARSSGDTRQLLAVMIVICLIGVIVDGLFGSVERSVRTRWGLAGGEA
jgi:NitT/TauT family transport system permease protein